MLHDANLVVKSGKGEADEVGFSHMVKDAEYHTKETRQCGFEQGNNMIKPAFLKSLWCLG